MLVRRPVVHHCITASLRLYVSASVHPDTAALRPDTAYMHPGIAYMHPDIVHSQVLVLVPFKGRALKFIQTLLSAAPQTLLEVENKARFMTEFGEHEVHAAALCLFPCCQP